MTAARIIAAAAAEEAVARRRAKENEKAKRVKAARIKVGIATARIAAAGTSAGQAPVEAQAKKIKNISKKRVTDAGQVLYKVKFKDGSAAEWLAEGDARITPQYVARFEERWAKRKANKGCNDERGGD